MISSVSAMNFLPIPNERDTTFDGKHVQGNQLLEKYKPIEIKNTFGLGKTLFEGYLSQHDDTCGVDCKSTIQVKLNQDGVLIDDVIFETLQDDGSWVEQNIRSYQFIVNGKKYSLGEEVKAGTYEIVLEGQKKSSRTVDWKIKTQGKVLDSWAVWGSNIDAGLEDYYTMNSLNGTSTGIYNNITKMDDMILTGTPGIVSGIISNAINFTSTSWGIINHTTNYNTTFTVNFWTNFKNSGSGGDIIFQTSASYGATATNRPDIRILTNGTLGLYCDSGCDGLLGYGNISLSDNTDYMITLQGENGNWRIYVNGVLALKKSRTATTLDLTALYTNFPRPATNAKPTYIWYDEIGIWNITLDEITILQLYNGGSGLAYILLSDNSYITLNSPINKQTIVTTLVSFNATANVTSGVTLVNMSLWTNETGSWGIRNITSLTGASNTTTWDRTFIDGDTILWNVQGCDSDGDCGFWINNYTVNVNTSLPLINIETPTGVFDYNYIGNEETLNVTFYNANLNYCWYDYNGTNITIDGCLTGIKNSITFTLESGNTNMTIYANDTAGNENSTFTSWSYKILENNRTHNSSSYETASETFTINLTVNSSLTLASLNYNGTAYTATQSGSIWSRVIDVPSGVSNNTINWSFTYAGATIESDYTTYQNVLATIFTLCSVSYTDDFLNITFKDEADLSAMNASLPTSTFLYYLGSGTVKKTYSLINSTDNYNYRFCATPDRTFHVDPYVQYKRDADYPQRTWDAIVQDYTNTLTTQILYLLDSSDGLYVTIQVTNNVNQLLSGVYITANREIGGTDTTVAFGTTGDAGTVTFWLNPDFSHDFAFTKTGYTDYETTFMPTQSSYTITMGGASAVENNTVQGILYSIVPANTYLLNDTSYTFGFNLTSSYWDVSDYGFNLRLGNGTKITGGNTGVEGTDLTKIYDVNNQTIIYLDYYWLINDDYTNVTRYWVVQNTANTQWSIAYFFTDLNTYLDSGIYGLDNFGRNLIVFLVLFISVGIMSYKFGAASPLAISSLIFGIIFFFDVVVGLIPTIRGIENLPTFLSALILSLAIFNKVRT